MDRLSDLLSLISRYVPVVEYTVCENGCDWNVFPAVVKKDTTEHKEKTGYVKVVCNKEELNRYVSLFGRSVVQKYIKGMELMLFGGNDEHFGPYMGVTLGGKLSEKVERVHILLPSKDYIPLLSFVDQYTDVNVLGVFEGFERFILEHMPRVVELNPIIVTKEGPFVVDIRMFST